jgi:NAD(P)-dependent dehydrogenase (short-subunit alcohol dehydrogenase family)
VLTLSSRHIAIVTGANHGIGAPAARALAGSFRRLTLTPALEVDTTDGYRPGLAAAIAAFVSGPPGIPGPPAAGC